MNRQLLAVVITLSILIAGAFTFQLTRQKAVAPAANPGADNRSKQSGLEEQTVPTAQETVNTNAGKYVTYSESEVAATQGTKVLFFHAPWCPQCRALDASIKAGEIPAGVTIFKTDYDTNQTLRKKYGVTIQTTLVRIDDQGNLVKKYVAYDEPTLASVKQNLLQ